MTRILVDSDILLMQTTLAAEVDTRFDDIHLLWSDPERVKESIRDKVEGYKKVLGNHPIVMLFSCPSRRYFRHEISPVIILAGGQGSP